MFTFFLSSLTFEIISSRVEGLSNLITAFLIKISIVSVGVFELDKIHLPVLPKDLNLLSECKAKLCLSYILDLCSI